MSEQESFSNQHTLDSDGVRVEATVQRAVNLALVHNNVPLVQAVRITNYSEKPLEDLQVTVTIDGKGSPLADPWTVSLSDAVAPGAHQRWDGFAGFAPSYDHLASLNESHPATVTVTVSRRWASDVSLRVAVQVLARNEWLNSPVFFESLAAFVQPNTRAVTSVLDGASQLLRDHTGDASIAGYQQGPERASRIAAAVYEALRQRDIRYVVPPASFEDAGQKVRTTGEVLEQRFGTCVDLAVAYAACIEQAGLHPLLWLIDGHAFGGYVREGGTLGQAVLTEANAMINLVESAQAVPVEAKYYDQSPAGTFAAALIIAKRHFQDPKTLRGVIDVHATHRSGTRPLPGEDTAEPATVTEGNAQLEGTADPLELPHQLREHPDEANVLLDVHDDAPARVRKWKRALLDLSTRNRLLNLGASSEVLDIHVPTDTLGLLDDLVHSGASIKLVAQDEISDLQRLQGARRAQDLDGEPIRKLLLEDQMAFVSVTAQAYVARMRKLQRAARTLLEETGNANLYLTVGALIYTTPSGNEARAPLFLLPVKIEGGTGRSAFELRVDSASVAAPNHCLIEWLRIKYGVEIAALETPQLDHSGIDIDAALPAIRAALVANRLDARIDEVASLAICQFSTFGMWRDLEHSWEILSRNPVVEHLALKAGETFKDPNGKAPLESVDVDEAEMPLPIPADGSQLEAVALAGAGRSFVLEGPPGTGKSQTITNVIAHALASGRTVLFVAEKQAALEVVKRRLEEVGLADFTLDLHGRSQRPSEIREQLKRAIDNIAAYDARGWEATCATFRARHAPLEEYPGRVHTRNGIGVSLWGAYENLQQYGHGPCAPIPATYVAASDSDEEPVKAALRNFARAARTAGLRKGHPWAIVGHVEEDLEPRLLADAARAIETCRARLGEEQDQRALLEGLEDPGELEWLLPHLSDRAAGPTPDSARLSELRASGWMSACQELSEKLERFNEQHAEVISTFTRAFLEHGETSSLTSAAEAAERGMFGKRKRAERFEAAVTPFVSGSVTLSAAQVAGLVLGVEAARSDAAKLSSQAWDMLGELSPKTWTPLQADATASISQVIGRLKRCDEFQTQHGALWQLIEDGPVCRSSPLGSLQDVANAWAKWSAVLGSGPAERTRWQAGRPWTLAWEQDGPTWKAEIADAADAPVRRWSRMVALLEPLREHGLVEFREAVLSCEIAAAEIEVAYLRGVAEASLRERRSAAGLDGFDAAVRDGEIEDLASAARASRSEQTVALPASLLKNRPYKANQLSGKAGELRRRLDAKRRGMSFRQLIESYGEEILQATPCFFVSPASLAQYVPPGTVTFDLVVFDEASQVAVPQAIGALGRGRASVIVGDAQQMPPTSVAKTKLVEEPGSPAEEDGAVLEDLESILTECVESGLPRLMLSWHYRSRDESLIAFSNAFYYEGRLASLPSPGSDPTTGVEMRRVQGHFNREDKNTEFRTNRVEAEAIVAEIQRRLADPELSEQSIGVVTFNAQQRDLVLNLLEECGDPLVARQLREDANEGIFVKNLENVQGDERDVILFSVAFSKPDDITPLPMNFGPLGTGGGEKRLNVAITRARRKVLVLVSFDPTDIDLSRTSSRGIAHLRSYLEMAAHGPSGLPEAPGRAVIGTDHVRERIAAALSERGYDVASDYGLSDFSLDIVVREPGSERWQVAIMLDGPRWSARASVGDRELTPLLLERLMRWGALVRLWLPEWLDDPNMALRRVEEAIGRAHEREERDRIAQAEWVAGREQALADVATTDGEDSDAIATSSESPEDQVSGARIEVETFTFAEHPSQAEERREQDAEEKLELAKRPSSDATPAYGAYAPPVRDIPARGAPYIEARQVELGSRDDLGRTTSSAVRDTISAAVRETVEVEGPIETSRLARSIGRRFGFGRVASGRAEFILESLPRELLRASELGEFAWPAALDAATWRGYRSTPEELFRPLTDIAPEEIVNAMSDLVAERPIGNQEELFRATIEVFGQRRLTSQTTARLVACLALAELESRLIRRADGRWGAGA
jgi:hypothetical protein